jgi:hypothetical protein
MNERATRITEEPPQNNKKTKTNKQNKTHRQKKKTAKTALVKRSSWRLFHRPLRYRYVM